MYIISQVNVLVTNETPFCFALDFWRWPQQTRLPPPARLGYLHVGRATFPPHLTQTQRGANRTHVIALRPQLAT